MLSWYVMHSKPQKEQWLYNQLSALHLEAYYPCMKTDVGKGYSRKLKPYFPGYLFVNVDLEQIGTSLLQWIPGSLGLVAFGGEPARLPDGLLQGIRQRVDEINCGRDNRIADLQPGEEVMIHSGIFAGCAAIFCAQLQGSERVQVLLRILQDQTMRINLPADHIRAKKQKRSPL